MTFVFCGAVAQLGERLTGSQKVRGSIPLSSTITLHKMIPDEGIIFFLVYSSYIKRK